MTIAQILTLALVRLTDKTPSPRLIVEERKAPVTIHSTGVVLTNTLKFVATDNALLGMTVALAPGNDGQ